MKMKIIITSPLFICKVSFLTENVIYFWVNISESGSVSPWRFSSDFLSMLVLEVAGLSMWHHGVNGSVFCIMHFGRDLTSRHGVTHVQWTHACWKWLYPLANGQSDGCTGQWWLPLGQQQTAICSHDALNSLVPLWIHWQGLPEEQKCQAN